MKKNILYSIFFIATLYYSCSKDTQNNTTAIQASVSSILCDSVISDSIFKKGLVLSNAKLTVKYKGGNGGTYSAISLVSRNVNGVTAKADAGTIVSGDGSITLKLNGTPQNVDPVVQDLMFDFNLGDKSCTIIARTKN